ncbi:peptidoglycan recognition protein family protein [Natrononativus amylolyticus]|uniref:peptidoglycan recognition protein family protein n=1 Tax=Natrononativus amylolyticus TaxID=2963434 RepID=UPI0020CD1002|nr:peptidoglycan recognition family protein [Natrononativus amylolyticus]
MERRRFLQATGATAGAGGLYATGIDTARASHTQTNTADRFVAADASNYSASSRGAGDINWIVVHCTVGSYSGAISWFQNSDSNVSAHYVVSNYDHTNFAPGHVTQMVHHEDVAWHASGTNSPSIGIEHEWHEDYGRYFTEECYQASASLVRELADQYDIPLRYFTYDEARCEQGGGIIGHRHAPTSSSHCGSTSTKSCPGPDWDPDTFMDYVRDGDGGGGGGGGEFQDGDQVVTTTDLNGREGPGLHYDVEQVLAEGTTGEIMNGPEDSDGITWWGVHAPAYNAWVWCSGNYLTHA